MGNSAIAKPRAEGQTSAQSQVGTGEVSQEPDVFISYQHDQQPQIKALSRKLRAKGYTCWLDFDQMGGGDSLNDKIDRGIRGCKVVVSCVTQKYSVSKSCCREVSVADAIPKPIIPLLLEDIKWPPSGPMSMVFAQLLFIKFYEKGQKEWTGPKFDELLIKLNEHLGAQGVVAGKMSETMLYAANDDLKVASPPEGPSDCWAARTKRIGSKDWSLFQFLFMHPSGELYGVMRGKFYKGPPPVSESENWLKRSECIGSSSWDQYQFLFFSPKGELYAVTKGGELYAGIPPTNKDDVWQSRAKMLGKSGWNTFRFMFFHPSELVLYGVLGDTFLKAPPPTDEADWWSGRTTCIGKSGWSDFKHLTFDPDGVLYGAHNDGRLLAGNPPVSDDNVWIAEDKMKGADGWECFQYLFFGK